MNMAHTGDAARRKIIRGSTIIEDTWRSLEDDAALPTDGDVILSLSRLDSARSELSEGARLGLAIPADADVRALAGRLDRVALITLSFPHFRDGRAYSQAALLRQMGYEGTLRATGDVLQDQLFFMRRCGIDEFALREDKDPNLALESLEPFSHAYQDAADARRLVPAERSA